jgi:hypothetical protein
MPAGGVSFDQFHPDATPPACSPLSTLPSPLLPGVVGLRGVLLLLSLSQLVVALLLVSAGVIVAVSPWHRRAATDAALACGVPCAVVSLWCVATLVSWRLQLPRSTRAWLVACVIAVACAEIATVVLVSLEVADVTDDLAARVPRECVTLLVVTAATLALVLTVIAWWCVRAYRWRVEVSLVKCGFSPSLSPSLYFSLALPCYLERLAPIL